MAKRPGNVQPKPVRWVGSSREDLRAFPEEVRRRVGGALWDTQLGLKAPYAKPLRSFGGAGVLEIVDDFAHQMYALITSQEAIDLQRIVLAEAPTNPELAEAFWNSGPGMTREMLDRFFARPDIRAQMRPDLPFDLLPCHLMSTITGELVMNLMRPHRIVDPEKGRRDLEGRLELFFHSILPPGT